MPGENDMLRNAMPWRMQYILARDGECYRELNELNIFMSADV